MDTRSHDKPWDAREITDSLLGSDCYVAYESATPPHSGIIPGAWGMTGRSLDVVLSDWLRTRGEWRGRRPAFYYADLAIEKVASENAEGNEVLAMEYRNQFLAAVVSHEVGHVAENGIDQSEPTATKHKFAHAVAAYSVALVGTNEWPPFFSHGSEWVRLALHAAYRANQAGWVFPISMLFGGEQYAIAEPESFEYALGDEPRDLWRVPLFEIPQFTSPVYFRRLWNRCVNHWLAQQTEYSKGVRAAIEMLQDERSRWEIAAANKTETPLIGE